MTHYSVNSETLDDIRSALKQISADVLNLYSVTHKRHFKHLNSISRVLSDLRILCNCIEASQTMSTIPVCNSVQQLAAQILQKRVENLENERRKQAYARMMINTDDTWEDIIADESAEG